MLRKLLEGIIGNEINEIVRPGRLDNCQSDRDGQTKKAPPRIEIRRGYKPKPTAYEKFLNYFTSIAFDDLTSTLFGRFNVKTPFKYFASIFSASTFSSSVKERLKER